MRMARSSTCALCSNCQNLSIQDIDPSSLAYTESVIASLVSENNTMEHGDFTAHSKVQVLDGGLATEIERRGFNIHVSLV